MRPFANSTCGIQTIQTGSWYQDEAWFVYGDPWVVRGSIYSYGSIAGIIAIFCNHDGVNPVISFREVLAFQ